MPYPTQVGGGMTKEEEFWATVEQRDAEHEIDMARRDRQNEYGVHPNPTIRRDRLNGEKGANA